MKIKKDFLIIGVGHFFEALILFATARVMTTLLSPEDVGHYALIYAFATMFFSIFVVPWSLYTQRRFFDWLNADVLSDYSKKNIAYVLITGCFSGLVSVAACDLFHVDLPFSNVVIFGLMAGVFVFMNLSTCFSGSLNMLQKRLPFVLCTVSSGVLILLLSSTFSLTLGRTADSWILGQISGYFLTMIAGGILFYRIVDFRHRQASLWTWAQVRQDVIDLLKFCWPLFIGSFILWVQSESYRFLLGLVSGVKVVGLFSVGFNLGNKISQKVMMLVHNFYNPIFFQEIADASKEKRSRVCAKYASIFFPLIILLGIFISSASSFLAVLFVAPAFQEAARISLFWAGLFCVFSSILSIYRMYAVSEMDMRVVIIPYLVGAITVVVLIPLLCPQTPFTGAGIALSAGVAASCLCLMIRMKKLLYVPFPWRRVVMACLWAIPFLVTWMGIRCFFPDPNFWQAVIAVLVFGVLEVSAQFLFARTWLFSWERYHPAGGGEQS